MLNINDCTMATCPALGRAFFVWVQGCPRRCSGCFNESTLPFEPRRLVAVDTLAQRCVDGGGGLVLSGGEPFSQGAALARLCDAVRAGRPGTPVLCYTGHTYDALVASTSAAVRALLTRIDVLIDGPFVATQTTDHPLLGSANQRIVRLSDRVERRALTDARRQLTMELRSDGRLQLMGTGAAGCGMHEIERALRRSGVVLRDEVPHER